MSATATIRPVHLYDRVIGWLLPLVIWLTPFIVFLPMKPTDQQGYFLQAATLLLLTAHGVAWMFGWRALPGRPSFPILLLLLLGVARGVSVVVGGQYLFILNRLILPLSAVLLFGMIVDHPRRQLVLRRATLGFACIVVVLAIYGIAQFFGFEVLRYSEEVQKNTVIATIGHPNFLGSVLGPMLFVVLGLVITSRSRALRLAGGVGILLILFCIALARTRAVWLGVSIGLLALVFSVLRYSLHHRLGLRLFNRLVAAVAIVVGLLGVLLALLPVLGRPIDFTERILASNEIKSRLYYWNAAIDLGATRPVFGIGFGMFDPNFWGYALEHQQSEAGRYYYDVLPAIAGRTPDHVHNEYLEVLAEQGYVGLTLLFAFLLFFFYFGWVQIMRRADPKVSLRMLAVHSALVVVVVDAFFGFPWRLPVSLLVMVLIVGWLYETISPQLTGEPEPPRFA